MKKKVSGLVSRYEKEKPSDDEEYGGSPGQRSDDAQTDKELEANSTRAGPRSSSPGKMVMRNVFQSLRSPGKKNKKGEAVDEKQTEAEDLPLSVGARVDNALRSIASERSKRDPTARQRHDDNDDEESTDKTDCSNGGSVNNKREYLITEHSNRTLVVDNKKNKSQSSKLPDTPWSNRNLRGTDKPEYSCYGRDNSEHIIKEGNENDQDYEAEYGTLALKGDDVKDEEEVEEELAPEILAMSAATERLKKNSKRSTSLTSIRKSSNDAEDSNRRSSRRISPGLIGKRRISSKAIDNSAKDTLDIPSTGNKTENSSEHSNDKVSGAKNAPPRSYSAGQLNSIARAKPRSNREVQRSVKSQSPDSKHKKTGRILRTGCRKSDSDLSSSNEVDDENELVVVDEAANEASETQRKNRGRSPGNLRIKNDTINSDDTAVSGDESEDDLPQRPTLERLTPRGRSPGSIRSSITMSGDINRDNSPHTLRRSARSERTCGSPGSLRKIGGRARSPGALSSLPESTSPCPSTSPSKYDDIMFEPFSTCQAASPPKRTTSMNVVPASPNDAGLSNINLGIPRAKSPGALARRPAKNLRTTQSPKAQSLFEKRSSPWTVSPVDTSNPAPARYPSSPHRLVSPRRKESRENVSKSLTHLYGEEGAVS